MASQAMVRTAEISTRASNTMSTVMQMRTVLTNMEATIASAVTGTQATDQAVLMLMNVMKIHAITMEHAQTQMEATSALVMMATLEMEPTVRTLMSVTDTMSIVMLTPTAQIFMELIIVSARTVTQEMELIAVMLMNAATPPCINVITTPSAPIRSALTTARANTAPFSMALTASAPQLINGTEHFVRI